MHKWVVVAVVLAASGFAQAQTVPPESSNVYSARKWPSGAGERGLRGVNKVEAATPLPDGTFTLTAAGRFSRASDFLGAGDTNTFSGARLVLAWQPIELLAVSASWSVVSNRNNQAEPRTTQSLGDPTIGVKLTHLLTPKFGIGFNSVFTIPTSAGGSGLDASAFVWDNSVLVSHLTLPWLALSANAGFKLDNTDKIFGSREISRAQRFTASIATVNQVLLGVGADTHFLVGERAALGPFAELTAGLGTGARVGESPILATIGTRFLPKGKDFVDIAVGADIRLAGEPQDNSTRLPGIAPWQLFGRISVHLGGKSEGGGTTVIADHSCQSDSDCGSGQVCQQNVCTVIKEVVREVEVAKTLPTFVIEGAVYDQTSGEPVSSAVVTFSGYEQSPLAVDYKTGKFRSFPLPVGEGLIKVTVTAPNYRPADQTVQRGTGETVTTLAFKVSALGEAALGNIKGSIKDGRSGKPLKGEIFIPALGKRIQSDKDGSFEAELKAGRYQVLISAPHYQTQKKDIEIRAGEVVILNLDMVGRR
jgi:hypothetical protein